jgi:hypothetical protein
MQGSTWRASMWSRQVWRWERPSAPNPYSTRESYPRMYFPWQAVVRTALLQGLQPRPSQTTSSVECVITALRAIAARRIAVPLLHDVDAWLRSRAIFGHAGTCVGDTSALRRRWDGDAFGTAGTFSQMIFYHICHFVMRQPRVSD